MKVYARYTPFKSKADAVYKSLELIYKAMDVEFQIEMKQSNNNDCMLITVVYDTADVINYIDTHNSVPVGRKPKELPSREELLMELDQGFTKAEIAKKYGVSRPTLYKRLGLNKKDE